MIFDTFFLIVNLEILLYYMIDLTRRKSHLTQSLIIDENNTYTYKALCDSITLRIKSQIHVTCQHFSHKKKS